MALFGGGLPFGGPFLEGTQKGSFWRVPLLKFLCGVPSVEGPLWGPSLESFRALPAYPPQLQPYLSRRPHPAPNPTHHPIFYEEFPR